MEGAVNYCTACDEDFGSVSAFDAHRVGGHEFSFSSEHPNGRRCLSIEELHQRAWSRDGRGRWRRPSDGAPWASRETQVTTQEPAGARRKDSGRLRAAMPSVRLPDSEKARLVE